MRRRHEIGPALNVRVMRDCSGCGHAAISIWRQRHGTDRSAGIDDLVRVLVVGLGACILARSHVCLRLETAWQLDAGKPGKPVVRANQHRRK